MNQGEGKFPPYLKMLSSLPFWATMLTHSGSDWVYYTLLSVTPTYLSNIQNYALEEVSYKKMKHVQHYY